MMIMMKVYLWGMIFSVVNPSVIVTLRLLMCAPLWVDGECTDPGLHRPKQTSPPGTSAAACGWPDTAAGLRCVGTRVDPYQRGSWPAWGQSRSSHAPACTGFWFARFWPGLYWSDSGSLPAASDMWGHSHPRSTGSPVRGSHHYAEPKFLKPALIQKKRDY